MSNIKKLDKKVYSKISAGEVVEKPASIIKELLENSLDAGATEITIEVEGGGSKKIVVTDNGCGIKKEDLVLAFEPHATSKITEVEDIENLATMGFRGEALSSIGAVAKVTVITKTQNDDCAYTFKYEGGEAKEIHEIAGRQGTKIIVEDLFYNVPVRAKFLRKPKQEEIDITAYVQKLMLANPSVNFKYIVDDKMLYNTTSCGIKDIIYTIYGKDAYENIIPVNYSSNGFIVEGYISRPNYFKSNKTYQTLLVNRRYVQNIMVQTAVLNAYSNFLMKGQFPLYVLNLTTPLNFVDVNVHPNKLEVKFENQNFIYGMFFRAINQTLLECIHVKEVKADFIDFAKPVQSLPKQEYKELPDLVSLENKEKDKDLGRNETIQGFSFSQSNSKISFKDSMKYATNTLSQLPTISLTEDKKHFEEKIEQEKLIFQNEVNPNYEGITDTLCDFKKLCVLFDTYIVLQDQDKIYLLDQHAGHERQLFDRYQNEIDQHSITIQDLIIPFVKTFNEKEFDFVLENKQLLQEFGFEFDQFGNNTIKVSGIPYLLSSLNVEQFFNDLLSDINGLARKPLEYLRTHIATMACKAAVKAGDILSDNEISILLNNFKTNKNVLLCPHGRPILVVLTKKEIEKWFKRIV